MSKPTTKYDYRATVLRWIDGDTLDVKIDLGFEVSVIQRVRLYGVNTPEMNSASPSDRTLARSALAMAESMAPSGSLVQLQSRKSQDKYGRYLATVVNDDGDDIAMTLIGSGRGIEYFGGKR